MTTFSESLRYPTERDDWHRTILIGGILTIFSFLVVPIILVMGYVVRVIQSRLKHEPQLPEFDDWETLLVDGIKVWVIGIVYLIIPFIVAMVTVGGAILSMATGTDAGVALGLTGLFGGLLVSFVLGVVFWYVGVASIVNFARTGNLSAAFDVETIKAVLFDTNYATAWGLALVVLLAAGAIGAMLNAIPILGYVIAAFIYFYAQVVAAILWADGFEASYEPVDMGQSPIADDPAI